MAEESSNDATAYFRNTFQGEDGMQAGGSDAPCPALRLSETFDATELMHERDFGESRLEGLPRVTELCLRWLTRRYPRLSVPAFDVESHLMWMDRDEPLQVADGFLEGLAARRRAPGCLCAWIVVFVGTDSGDGSKASDIHANGLVLREGSPACLTRFEPRGAMRTYDPAALDWALADFAQRHLGTARYEAPADYQTRVGLQAQQVMHAPRGSASLPRSGPCVMWSVLIIMMCLEFPDLPTHEVVRRLEASVGDVVTPTALIQSFTHHIAKHVVPRNEG